MMERERKGKPESKSLGDSHDNPVVYDRIEADDPDRAEKLERQRDQFEKDAAAGKIISLTELFSNHGM